MKLKYCLGWLWAKITGRNLLIIQRNKDGSMRLLEPENRFELTHDRLRYIAGMYQFDGGAAWTQVKNEASVKLLFGLPVDIQDQILSTGEYQFFWADDNFLCIGGWVRVRLAWNTMWEKHKELAPKDHTIKCGEAFQEMLKEQKAKK